MKQHSQRVACHGTVQMAGKDWQKLLQKFYPVKWKVMCCVTDILLTSCCGVISYCSDHTRSCAVLVTSVLNVLSSATGAHPL